MLRAGLIGLPASGKSTLFQLLTSAREAPRTHGKSEAHVGISRVPDDRLDRLTSLFQPKKRVPATVEFADMAAARAEAKALLDVVAYRNADALLHVVRAFRDPAVPHVHTTIDPAPPIWSAGTVNLYTREFFELVRSRLTPDGTFCLWFPEGTREEVTSLFRTFVDVFPNAAVLSGPHGWGFYLLGPKGRLDWTRFAEQSARAYGNPRIVADITEFGDALSQRDHLPGLLMFDADGLRRLGRDGVLITDDHPFTEFPLWRYLRNGRQVWHPRSIWLPEAQRR